MANNLEPLQPDDGAESYTAINQRVQICPTHTKENWQTHIGYEPDALGGIHCTLCPWGTFLPGYMRLKDGKIIDLRDVLEG